jgi:hypothetical protein
MVHFAFKEITVELAGDAFGEPEPVRSEISKPSIVRT